MDLTICFKQLSLELENIQYLKEKKKKELQNLNIICDDFADITINVNNINKSKKKKKLNSKNNTKNKDNILSIKSDGIKKKKIFKNISKYEVNLILNPKKKKMIPFETFQNESIFEIILKLPTLIEESCYTSLITTRQYLPFDLNSLYKKSKSRLTSLVFLSFILNSNEYHSFQFIFLNT